MRSGIVAAVEGGRALATIEKGSPSSRAAPPPDSSSVNGFPQSRHAGWWALSVRWMGGRHAPRRPVLARAAPSDGRSQPDLSRERRAHRPPLPGRASDAAARPRRRQERHIRRTTPLVYVEDGRDVVIVASKGGHSRHPAWYHNLRAHPATTVQIGREHRAVHARVAGPDEHARLWPKAVATYDGYRGYQQRTDRQIPLIILEPRP